MIEQKVEPRVLGKCANQRVGVIPSNREGEIVIEQLGVLYRTCWIINLAPVDMNTS